MIRLKVSEIIDNYYEVILTWAIDLPEFAHHKVCDRQIHISKRDLAEKPGNAVPNGIILIL